MELKSFSVVNFLIDNSVEVVPSSWITEDQKHCVFPSNKPQGLQKLQAQAGSKVDKSWPVWEITILKSYGKWSSIRILIFLYCIMC